MRILHLFCIIIILFSACGCGAGDSVNILNSQDEETLYVTRTQMEKEIEEQFEADMETQGKLENLESYEEVYRASAEAAVKLRYEGYIILDE